MNNPSAFPYVVKYPSGTTEAKLGMSLRDYFAAQALPAAYTDFWECRRGLSKVPDDWAEPLAKEVYVLADAMLAERERGVEA